MHRVKGAKRAGPQTCDNCSREFTVELWTFKGRIAAGERYDWDCPHCGYDNKQVRWMSPYKPERNER